MRKTSTGAEVFSFDQMETTDQWYLFDRLMLMVDRHDAFVIDLSGEATVKDTVLGDSTAEVTAQIDGVEGEVRFRLIESPAGKWRVHQVLTDGADDTIIPWAATG